MKGGITSGIVYPLAIVEIAKAFRFRNIGGTSAGAIAAAAAAAAELGRCRAKAGISFAKAPFQRLADLPQLLSSSSPSGLPTLLLAFFRPHPNVRSVFKAFVAATQSQSPVSAVVITLLRHHWLAAVVALTVGLSALGLIDWADASRFSVAILAAILVAVAIVFMLAVVGGLVWRRIVNTLPHHGYGLCSGMPREKEAHPEECLTLWLTNFLNDLSGQPQEKPLTFGDLQAERINLQMMTTCLTLGRPFRLPFRDDEQVKENRQFWYREEEFRALFPKAVVDWMVARERPFDERSDRALEKVDSKGFRRLPAPHDLPVVVAVRMSLSFPILLSAIPLYAVDFRKADLAGRSPEKCWFTDGGVGSNFPIHFFDTPLPVRPTFGLDLGSRENESETAVVFPQNNGDARLAYWKRFNGQGAGAILNFLGVTINVAKDWNHETLSHMPGFRDRIGLIRLTKKQGGLNLAMSQALISELTEYGREAGREFVARFGNASAIGQEARPTMNWENHQLIRLRLFLGAMAESLESLARGAAEARQLGYPYDRFFSSANHGPRWYQFLRTPTKALAGPGPKSQVAVAEHLSTELERLGEEIRSTASVRRLHPAFRAPRPTPELRLRPRV